MNILSLFNGISGLHLACDKVGIVVDKCYYSEIDKYANQVTEKQYPNDIALGDVTKWREWDIDWASIDLVGAGFPCQAWSVAGQQQGDKDERGMLFWTTLEIIKHVLYFNPKAKFLMENVKMKKDFEEYITHHTTQALGYVEKTLINSALVSAQNRNRYYWTNFKVTQPDDKWILLKDILEYPMDDKYKLSDEAIARFKPCQKTNSGQIGTTAHEGKIGQRDRVYDADGKMVTLTATIYKQPPQYAVSGIKKATNVNPSGRGMNGSVYHTDAKSPTLTTNKGEGIKITNNEVTYRKLTPLECERLQTLPEIKKSAIIEFSEKHGKIEWLLEHQRTNVSVGAKYRKLQSSALSAEEKELNQCASAAMSCLSISQADQEMPVQKNVHIILGEGQLQLNYQGKPLLSVNVAELLKKQVHPALGADIAQEIAGINSILEKILHNGKGELPVSLKISTHQESGGSNAGRYGQEIELGVKDAKLSAVQDLMDTYTILDHGQNLKTLDLNLQTLFYSVSSVIDLFTLEKIQKGSSLKISIEYSCGFTSMISNTQRYKSIGNGWTIDVIAHILKCMEVNKLKDCA